MTTPDDFKKFFPSTQNTNIGTFWGSKLSSRFKGLVSQGTDTIAERRYGYRNETVSPAVVVETQLHLQATSYVKRVKLESFVGNVSTSSYDTWLRVYREVWCPSKDPKYRDYLGKQTYTKQMPNPFLPSNRKFFDQHPDEGSGSIPTDPYANKEGQYVLLWLRWNGIGAEGPYTPYGALIDWYWTGFDDSRRYLIDLDHKPTNGSSKSRSSQFSSIGLNTYFDAASNTNGLYLVNYKPGGGASEARYLLRDNPSDPIPVLQSSKSTQIKINTLNLENSRIRTSYGGSDIGLYEDVTDKNTLAPGDFVQPGTVLNTSTLSRYDYEYSQLVLKKDNKNYVIVVDHDTNEKINLHRKNIQGNISNVNMSTTGGKPIIASGSNQNYIESNINFEKNPGPPTKWEAKVIGNEPITLTVVDGTNLDTPILGPLDLDTKWIAGYAPLADTKEAKRDARANYYYILPAQKRDFINVGAGTCLCKDTSDSNPTSAFTTPSNKCTTSLHFGKFLKWEVNSSIGFKTTELQDYIGAVKIMAKQSISDALVGSSFSGYYFASLKDAPNPITFSLADVDGFRGGSKQKFPSAASVGAGSTADRTQSNTGEVSSSGSSVPGSNNRPPLDWKKIITDSMNKLLQGSTIDKLTPERLSKYLANRLKEGAPLSLVKQIALESILNAKLAALQSGGKNRKQAFKELENDPLYQSLVLAVGAAKKPTNTGGTDTGSTNATDSSKQDKTIRISVFRGLPGTRGNARPTASVVGQPELVQTFSVSQDDADTGTSKFRNFIFPFVPREVTYSGIGTQWTEIPRSGNYPIVDWTGFNLLKISFNFDIVNTNFKNKQGFGLSYSCEDQITRLREMAQTPYPVTFLNMDKFMQNEVRWPLLTSGRGIEFVIAEFSVTSVHRTGGSGAQNDSVPNQISRATCSMTLQEIPIETVEIVQMPKIVPCKKNCSGDIPTKEQTKEYLLFMAGKASV